MPENTKENKNSVPANKKKSSLGRGLGSLLGGMDMQDTPAKAPKEKIQAADIQDSPKVDIPAPVANIQTPIIPEESQIWMIAIDRLVPNTQQPRQVFTADSLRELTASIKEKGILQPITARRKDERTFEIIAGERRYRAAQAAGLHEVPVILKKVSEQDSLEYAIIENIQREDLNPMDEAEAYNHLLTDYSLTQQQVADKLGKERSTVANSLRLLSLPVDVKSLLRKNEISTGHAKVLLGLEHTEDQLSLVKQIISGKLSVRATEKLASLFKASERKKNGQTVPPSKVSPKLIEALSAELQKLLGTKVSIDYLNAKGKLQIHFYADDQLTQIVEKMRRAWEK